MNNRSEEVGNAPTGLVVGTIKSGMGVKIGTRVVQHRMRHHDMSEHHTSPFILVYAWAQQSFCLNQAHSVRHYAPIYALCALIQEKSAQSATRSWEFEVLLLHSKNPDRRFSAIGHSATAGAKLRHQSGGTNAIFVYAGN
ncbi:MAG: hypothetical protein AAF724_05905 [Pseudomonadota bacterium]